MSILIKGIDLPKEGEDVTLEINHKGEARVYSTELKDTDTDTQAIQIDRPHGRIVELKDIRYCAFSSDGKSRDLEFLLATQVEALPTILEAEE